MSTKLKTTFDGAQGRDTLTGTDGDDVLNGRQAEDVLFGGAGNDLLSGGQGRDTLVGGAGNDLLYGGNGRDTAVFSDVAANYAYTRLDDGRIVVQGVSGLALADGTDTLTGIEALRFVDRTIDSSVVPCFVAGTRILTVAGERAVEDLREGDAVLLAGGGTAQVVWIGRRTVEVARHAWPDLVRPVRIRAGALADGVPKRDLLLSPEHALLLDGALVPAGLLANGRSIVQERGGDRVTYLHVELPAHAALIAEGAAAESYLDLDNREAFEDADDAITELHPHFGPRSDAEGCAPRLAEGPEVVAIRARLAERAAERFPMTARTDGDLHLRIDGAVLHAAPGTHRFAVPAGAREVRIISTASCPALSGGGGDRRMLGVALSAIRLTGADGATLDLPLDDRALDRGFHPVEQAAAHRWTDGEAVLPPQVLAPFAGAPITLELTVAAVQPVWVAAAA